VLGLTVVCCNFTSAQLYVGEEYGVPVPGSERELASGRGRAAGGVVGLIAGLWGGGRAGHACVQLGWPDLPRLQRLLRDSGGVRMGAR
jgi:hypothetical protein